MKKRVITLSVLSVLIILSSFLFISCAPMDDPAVAGQGTRITALENWRTNTAAPALAALSNYATKDEVTSVKSQQAALQGQVNGIAAGSSADTVARITALETKVTADRTAITEMQAQIKTLQGSTTSGGTVNPTTPTGSMGYVIVNPQQYYQFSSSGNFPIDLKITNNRSDSRYVRPQISITAFSGSATVGATATATVISSTQGQTPITFTVTPAGATVTNNAVFISTGGGVNGTGEYLLGSGTAMDIYLNIVVTGGSAILWNISVTGSDRAIQ